jgi:hypothetical protein
VSEAIPPKHLTPTGMSNEEIASGCALAMTGRKRLAMTGRKELAMTRKRERLFVIKKM